MKNESLINLSRRITKNVPHFYDFKKLVFESTFTKRKTRPKPFQHHENSHNKYYRGSRGHFIFLFSCEDLELDFLAQLLFVTNEKERESYFLFFLFRKHALLE